MGIQKPLPCWGARNYPVHRFSTRHGRSWRLRIARRNRGRRRPVRIFAQRGCCPHASTQPTTPLFLLFPFQFFFPAYLHRFPSLLFPAGFGIYTGLKTQFFRSLTSWCLLSFSCCWASNFVPPLPVTSGDPKSGVVADDTKIGLIPRIVGEKALSLVLLWTLAPP